MPGLRSLKQIIEGGVDNIPALRKMLDSKGAKLSDVYELDRPFYHGTGSDFDQFKKDQYFSSSPEISSGYSVDPWEIYDLESLDKANKFGWQPNVQKLYTAKAGRHGSYYDKDNLKRLAESKGGELDDDLPWLDIDDRSFDGWLNKHLDRKNTGLEFDWDAEYTVDGDLVNPASTERMIFDPESDTVNALPLDAILAHPEGAKLRQIAATAFPAGLSALASMAPSDAQAHGTISAPKHPTVNKIADIIQIASDSVKGSPAEYMLPGGDNLAAWLRQLSYGEKSSNTQRASALMEMM